MRNFNKSFEDESGQLWVNKMSRAMGTDGTARSVGGTYLTIVILERENNNNEQERGTY